MSLTGSSSTPTPPPVLSIDPRYRVSLKIVLRGLGMPIPTELRTPDDDENTFSSDRKRKMSRDLEKRDTFDHFMGAAKFFIRAGDTFPDFRRTLEYGSLDTWGTEEAGATTLNSSERAKCAHHASVFKKVLKVLPPDAQAVLRHLYLNSIDCPAPWKALRQKLNKSGKDAREHDTNKLKHKLAYLVPNPTTDIIIPVLTDAAPKNARWLAHPMIRYYVLPPRYSTKLPPLVYGQNPNLIPDDELSPEAKAILDRIASGTLKTHAKDMFTCLYADGSYDPEHYQVGLFRGHALVRVLIHVWLGPGQVLALPGDEDIPKGCNADIFDVSEVTEEMAAYAVCQLRTMIGRADCAQEKDYKLSDLYKNVLAAFKDDSDVTISPTWAQDTLDWLTERVFNGRGRPANNEDDGYDSVDEIAEQRARNRATPSAA
ncbi:hypothetical protein GGX14DRAFT_565442 [Mycena pura]|uniref:Uncharacterized protein n=1 Tax=Mycena pura TaxID=153505 RepID=A0AAD6YFQ1_9AGAR|nr:hypothetical protein GGX14DRAFT_565442 [Mycena pura]